MEKTSAVEFLMDAWRDVHKRDPGWEGDVLVGADLFDDYKGEFRAIYRLGDAPKLTGAWIWFKNWKILRSERPGYWLARNPA